MKMNKLIMAAATSALVAITIIALFASNADSQTYKSDFSTQLILAGNKTDVNDPVTLLAPTNSAGGITLTLPNAYPGGANYVLTSGTNGIMSWQSLSNFGVASVTGTAPIQAATAGGAVTVSLNNDATLGVSGGNLGLNLTHANTWGAAQTFNSGINSSGSNDLALTSPSSQAVDLNSTNANGVNIGTGASSANAIDIGNGTGNSGTYSTTTLAGLVNLTGTVHFTNAPVLPAGSVTNANLANSTIGTTSNGSITVPGTMTLGDASDAFNLNMSNSNTWASVQNFNSGIASTSTNNLALTSPTGQTINLNNNNGNGINIGSGTGDGNAINIGNGTAPLSGTYSTTTIAGAVSFTGTVSLPAGSISASSISLGNNHIFIGNGGNATDAPMTGDVSIAYNAGNAATSITNTAGNDIVAAINNSGVGGTTTAINAPVGITATSLSAGSGNITTSGTVSGGTGTFTNLSGTTMTGNLAMGSNNITGTGSFSGAAITGTGNAQVGTGASTTNKFGTGNGATNTIGVGGGTPSTTTILGNVNLPALSGTGYSGNNSVSVTANTHDLVIAANVNSYSTLYLLNVTGGSWTVGGFSTTTAGTPATGTMLMMINASATNAVTLTTQDGSATSNTGITIPGGNAIMGPGGSASFIFDGTYWHMISSQ